MARLSRRKILLVSIGGEAPDESYRPYRIPARVHPHAHPSPLSFSLSRVGESLRSLPYALTALVTTRSRVAATAGSRPPATQGLCWRWRGDVGHGGIRRSGGPAVASMG
jgi:hypothetical protein